MKRKVLLLAIALMLVATGVVSAAANWGKFEGYNIVKLVINGKEVVPKDTPPVILKGRTMVPLSMLEQAGLSAKWDSDTYTVNVASSQSTKSETVDSISITKEIISYGGTGLTLMNMQNDMTGLVYFEKQIDYDTDWSKIWNVFNVLAKVNPTFSRVEYGVNGIVQGVVEIRTKNFIDYTNGVISDTELQQLWLVSGPMFDTKTTYTPPVLVNPIIDTSITGGTNSTITSKIKDTFNGFEEGNLYELDNGQIWKQTGYDYKYAYKYRPKVVIYKDGSSWYMSVDGVDKHVKVERLK